MWSRFANEVSGGAVMDAVQKVECLPVPEANVGSGSVDEFFLEVSRGVR